MVFIVLLHLVNVLMFSFCFTYIFIIIKHFNIKKHVYHAPYCFRLILNVYFSCSADFEKFEPYI